MVCFIVSAITRCQKHFDFLHQSKLCYNQGLDLVLFYLFSSFHFSSNYMQLPSYALTNISTANIASPINLLFAAWHLTSPVWIYLKITNPERWSLLARDRLFSAQFSIIRVQWLQLPNVEKIEKNFIWPNSAIWYVLSNMTSKK